MMCAAYERILLSEDVPFTNRCCTNSQMSRRRDLVHNSGKCRLWASKERLLHGSRAYIAARHAMMDLCAGATSGQTSIMTTDICMYPKVPQKLPPSYPPDPGIGSQIPIPGFNR